MTQSMTFDDLRELLVQAAGAADGVELGPALIDADLYDIGYDSLALMETVALIKQRTGVEISDDEVTELRTFRLLLDRVNSPAGVPAGEGR